MIAISEYAAMAEDASLTARERTAARTLVDTDRLFNQWELDQAVTSGRKTLDLFRQTGDQTGIADALYILIRSLGSQENVEEASDMARSELAMFRSTGDAVGEAKMLLLQAEMCYNRDDGLDDAVTLAREALQRFEESDHARGQAQALMSMAEALSAGGKHKATSHPAQKAARLFRQIGDETESTRAFLLFSQSEIGSLSGGSRESTWSAWEEVKKKATDGLRQAQALKDTELIASALCQMAEVQNAMGDYDEALKAANEAAQLHRERNNPQDEASALHWVADTHLKCERYNDAREVVETIRQLGQRHEDEGIVQLADDILKSMQGPASSSTGPADREELASKNRARGEDEPRPAPPPPGRLVRNLQGDVMDVRSGLVIRPEPMNPMNNIADIATRIIATYTAAEFDNEIPLMQAGIVTPVGAELRGYWQRKYKPRGRGRRRR